MFYRDLRQALQKTKKRVEDQFKKNFGFRKGKKKDSSLEESSGYCKLPHQYQTHLELIKLGLLC